jgi:predicted ester cyclase
MFTEIGKDDQMSKSPTERNRDTVLRFFDGTHGGNIDVIDDTVSPNVVTHGFPGHSPTSIAEYKQFFRDYRAAFTNMDYQKLSVLAEGDRVAVRFAIAVDHTGDYLAIAPTGKRVAFDGMVLYRLENGLIVETWLHLDGLSFLSQIGAVKQAA